VLRALRIDNLVLIREAELELAPGLNVVTGETGAGKTILAQAIGLLLGAKGDSALVGPGAAEAYVEAELDLPDGLLEDESLQAVAELAPEDEPGLVAARRVFADGRSRAYAWGRAAPREDVAALVERLVAMSGQFEQRRLARPAHQLELVDAFAGDEQVARTREARAAWRDLQAARRHRDEVARAAGDLADRAAELEALVAAAEGLSPSSEDELRAARERLRNASGLAEAAAAAAEAVAPELADGEAQGAADLASRAARALEPVAPIARELADAAGELADAAARLRETASSLRGFLESLDADPARLEAIEADLARIADAKRRFGLATAGELVEAAERARAELDELAAGGDPLSAAGEALAGAEERYEQVATRLRDARRAAVEPFTAAARAELAALGLGEDGIRVELEQRGEGPSGRDGAAFLVRPNPGLPWGPVAATASGGELSRIALALRAAAHARAGEPTIVFDEIDAGIGGRTAHAVADALRRLADTVQVITITHLPQIARVADRHFRVVKVPGDPTHTMLERLSEDERKDELERMLGGAEFLSSLR
jgi:DNA repair protein RecN (Recombination protein N)